MKSGIGLPSANAAGRPAGGARRSFVLGCCMAKGQEPVDDLLDALIWMRRKAKKHEPVDEIIAALLKMRRDAKKKLATRKVKERVRSKSRQTARRSGRQ
jgi:hypothetical protein